MTYSAFRHVEECPVVWRGGMSISPCICHDNAAVFGVTMDDFGEIQCIATSPAKARYHVFKQGKECGYYNNFREFMTRCKSVRRLKWSDQIDR